jgi:hydrogenase nickel incorporation protein HypA/HybF
MPGMTRLAGEQSDMHEMGIILHMANMLDETAKEQNLTKIGSVTLEVGEVSGIMTDLFVDCWNYFKVKHPVLAESELRLVTIPAVTFCGNCGKTYETVRYGKECPYCHSEETWLVDGNQCVIKEIEAECEEDDLEEEGFEEDPDDDDLDYRAGDFDEDE